MKATVTVMLKDGVLDAPGRAIAHQLGALGFPGIANVRAGRVIELDLAESDPASAKAAAEAMADKLLANPVIEQFSVTVAP